MSTRKFLIAFAMLFALGPAGQTFAQDAPSPNTGGLGKLANSGGGLELAAFTLNPLDSDEPNNGLSSGRYVTIEEDATEINNVRSGSDADEADLLTQLDEAGWQARYYSRFGTPDGDNPNLFATSVYNSVTEYKDSDGATAGYEILTSANADGGYLKARGADKVGDDSLVTRYQWTTSAGAEVNELDIVFSTGNLVAEIILSDFTGEQPDIDSMNTLAPILQERLDGAPDVETPGISWKTLTVKGDAVENYFAYYKRLDDVQFGSFGASKADIRSDDEYYSGLGLTSTYSVNQGVPIPGAGDSDYYYFNFQLNTFKNGKSAQSTLDEWNDTFTTNPPTGLENAKVAREAGDYGDGSGTFSYTYAVADGTEYSGYRSHVLVGDYVFLIAVDGPDGVDFAAYEKLVNAAVKCASKDSICKSVAIPAGFEV